MTMSIFSKVDNRYVDPDLRLLQSIETSDIIDRLFRAADVKFP